MMRDELVWIFDVSLIIKNYDFDRVVLFVDLAWLKSVDFTGVLLDWWSANRLVLMCCFFIVYGVFGGVRENALFSRVWWDFWVICGDFWRGMNWWKWRKMGVLSKWVSKWCFGFGLGEMSRKCRFYKGLRGFLVLKWWFLV